MSQQEIPANDGNNQNNLPAMGYVEHNVSVDPNQPRQPSNLRDLLRYTAEARGSQHGTEQVNQQMDEERRQWLEKTLKSLTIDVVEELLKAIDVLKEAGTLELQDNPSRCENALEIITNHVDDIDTANDFYKIGGFCVFGPCLASAHSCLRWRVAEIIAELTQNNPFCQERILEAHLLPVLMTLVDSDPHDMVRVKAMYAISCLVRGHKGALAEFQTRAGFSLLLRAIQSDVEKLQMKAAFLLCSLCSGNDSIKGELCEMGFAVQLAGMLTGFHRPVNELVLQALSVLVAGDTDVQSECRRPDLHFKQTLSDLIRNTCGKEEYLDENVRAQELLHLLFSPVDEGER